MMNDLGIDELFDGRLENDKVVFDLHPAIRDLRADELLVRVRLEIENLENYLKTATGDEKRREIEAKKLDYLRLFLARIETGDLPPSPHAYGLTRS